LTREGCRGTPLAGLLIVFSVLTLWFATAFDRHSMLMPCSLI
jgi:hypothetical protein